MLRAARALPRCSVGHAWRVARRGWSGGIVSKGTTRTCTTATLSEEVYHSVSQLTLDAINETLEDFADEHGEGGEVDVECAADVLSLALGDAKFVLNKQAPNKQLWLSSPFRGPLRYDYDQRAAAWLNNRDAHHLLPALAQDIHQASGHPICFDRVARKLGEAATRA